MSALIQFVTLWILIIFILIILIKLTSKNFLYILLITILTNYDEDFNKVWVLRIARIMPVLCSLDIYLNAKLKCPQGQKHGNAGKSAADGDIMESCSDKKVTQRAVSADGK